MKITITLSNGQKVERTFDKSIVTIGRSIKSDFQIPDESLSRHHCQIEIVNGEFFIMDLDSSNGVFLNLERIETQKKIKFTTFFQLSIGPLECVVSDSEITRSKELKAINALKLISDSPKLEFIPTKPARKINSSALNTPFVNTSNGKKTKSTKNNVSWLLPVAVVILMSTVFYIQGHKDDHQSPPRKPEEMLEARIPIAFKSVQDEFETIAEYKRIDSLKACPDMTEICKSIGLDSEKGEGVYNDGKSVYVFFMPHLHPKNLDFKSFNEQEIQNFLGLYHLLDTPFFKNFTKQLFAQLHLVLKDESGKLNRVHRFHVKYFWGNEQGKLLTALASATESGKPEQFWAVARPILKSKELFE